MIKLHTIIFNFFVMKQFHTHKRAFWFGHNKNWSQKIPDFQFWQKNKNPVPMDALISL